MAALGDDSYDLLVAAQLRWNVGVASDPDHARQWLERAALSDSQTWEMPAILNQWAQMSLRAIKG